MFGRTVCFFVIAMALIGVTWWVTSVGRVAVAPEAKTRGPFEYGELLYPPADAPAGPEVLPQARVAEPIVLPDFTVSAMDSTNVPAQAEGQILFIGTTVDVKDVGNFPPGEVKKVEIFRGGRKEPFFYRRLKETEPVAEGQVLGMINPAKAFDKLAIAEANLEVAESDALAAESVHKTAMEEEKRAKAGSSARPPSVSPSEYNIRRLEAEKAYREMLAKRSKIKAAQNEVYSAQTEVSWYVIRNPLRGTSFIKSIDKRAGDATKNLETVMQLQSNSLLRAEGMADVPYISGLLARKGTKVRVEPTYEEPPLRTLIAHFKEVTSVAVGRDLQGPVVISGSADRSVGIWDATTGVQRVAALQHPEAVRVVAAAPRDGKRNMFLSGCADGSVRLWDLDRLNERPVLAPNNPHRDAVTALAFSPDGRWFATGGADNLICLWSTEDARLLYRFDAAHGVDNPPQGQVTALSFTPQCRLVAACRDNTLRVWELCELGARPVGTIADRSGTVPLLGVSQDGRQMLFDQGKTLRVLSVPDSGNVAAVKKPASATPFDTLALFSPDGALILTAGAAEGRLQLWSAPSADRRAFEVRVLSSTDRSNVTCAAFAPKDAAVGGRSFAASGTREGQVMVWSLPTAKEIDEAPVAGTLTLVDTALEPGARQARVGVEIDNANNRLSPGKQATVVVTP